MRKYTFKKGKLNQHVPMHYAFWPEFTTVAVCEERLKSGPSQPSKPWCWAQDWGIF